MARVVRVTPIQLPVWKEGETLQEIKEVNLKRIFTMLKTAGERNSDVAVFGEIANVRNLPFNEESLLKYADSVPGLLTDQLGEIAKGYSMNIIAPILGLCNGKLRNVALAISRQGKIVGEYYKVHLPEPEVKAGIVPGEDFAVIPLDFGRVGVMICMDIEYPEVALCLMLRGAEIIFFPHVQSSWGEVDWEIRYRARAVDTGLYLVSACYGIRDEEAWRPGMMLGRSGIIGPDSSVLAEASRYVEVLTRDIDLDRKRISNFHFGENCERTLAVMASRRPELYGELTKTKHRDEALRGLRT
ncbi:MAG: carbon-nitrogen hydrolase family protein [Candidatus Bathyarchaeia archaeon]